MARTKLSRFSVPHVNRGRGFFVLPEDVWGIPIGTWENWLE